MNEKDMQHGRNYNGQGIKSFVATEKFDGCRAYWDGENLWSRGGLKIRIPDYWRTALPAGIHLDGEVYDGVDGLYRCGSAVRYGNFTPSMLFMVFDCPSCNGDYQTRMDYAAKFRNGPLQVAAYRPIKHLSEVRELLAEVLQRGGEGLILRNPKLKYMPGRTAEILKIKERFLKAA